MAKKKKVVLFFVDAVKLARAKKLAAKPSDVRRLYEKFGGLLQEGRGIEEV